MTVGLKSKMWKQWRSKKQQQQAKAQVPLPKRKQLPPWWKKMGDENIVVSTRIISTDARTTAKVTAAARAKAKSSKDIEKWEDKERMTVNSNDDVLCHQLRVGEVA